MTFLLLACCCSVQPMLKAPLGRLQQASVMRNTFAKDEEGWTAIQALGKEGKVSVVHDPAYVKVGTGSLDFEYSVGKGQMAAARLPLPDGAFAKMRSLHFWLRPDHTATFMLTLDEREGGGRYVSMFYGRKNVWQEVALGLSDFTVSTSPDAPKDEDGRLDPDQIAAVSITDLDQFLTQSPELAKVATIDQGTRHVYISDFQALPTALPYASLMTPGVFRLDTYVRPQIGWGSIGTSTWSISDSSPLGERALRADYHTVPGHVAVMFKQFPIGTLEGMGSLSLRLASSKPCKLLVQVEEDDGVKYNTTYDLPGDSTALTASLGFPGFTLGEVPDPNGKLDVKRIHQVAIIDLTGVVDPKDQENSLWIGTVAGKL